MSGQNALHLTLEGKREQMSKREQLDGESAGETSTPKTGPGGGGILKNRFGSPGQDNTLLRNARRSFNEVIFC